MSEHSLNPRRGSRLRNILAAPAMRFRDFRLLWLSGVFNSTGFIGEQVVLGWLVLELSDSPLMVGAALALRMAPFLLLGVIAGAIADRVDRRKLLRGVSISMAALSAVISLIIMLDLVALWHLLLITFAGGCLRAMHQPARQSFAYDIVGPNNLVNGLSFLSLGMRVGAIGGSLVVGFLVGRLGADVAYMVLAISYIGSATTLQFIRSPGQSTSRAQQPLWQNLKELGVELRQNSTLRVLLILAATVEILGFSHQVLLPVIARDVLDVGAEGLGLMNALRSIGGITAILALSSLGEVRRKGLLYLAVLHIFGISLLFLGVADTFYPAILAIIVINGMGALSDILSQSLVQTVVPNELRGRAMGSWVLAVGLGPVGHLQIGALASALGVGFALTAHGAGLVALAVGALALFPRLRRL
ncbi:MAG: MFS transporter [Dehalococcoidia bacterium]|nr:MFS transporter [Dehalococcoidia bacterium]